MSDKKQTAAEIEEAAFDQFMVDGFGTNVDLEAHPNAKMDDLDTLMGDEPADEEEEAPEGDEGDEGEEEEEEESEEGEEEEEEEESDEDEEDEDDDTDEDDESEEGDEDGESEDGEANTDEGDGADETLSDGQMALDMMIDNKLAAYLAPSDDFDPATVGEESEYVQDAKEVFGADFDEDYVAKMGKANFKSAMRRATKQHEAGAEKRVEARREADTQRLVSQSNALKTRFGEKAVLKVANRMAVLYQQKIDKTSLDAANTVSVEAYYRLAGGTHVVPKKKAPAKAGVASRQAKRQKKKAVQAQRDPTQVGNARKPGKRKSKQDRATRELEAHLNDVNQLDALLFGE